MWKTLSLTMLIYNVKSTQFYHIIIRLDLQYLVSIAPGTGQDWYYHWKAEELKRVNKSELVPTLIAIDPETNEPDETKVCIKSISIRASRTVLHFHCCISPGCVRKPCGG